MKYNRTYNFSAGPAMMPEPVLEEIRDEMMNYRGSGMCVMEMSHRSPVFQQIIDEAEQDLRDLMGIPDNYKVLFIQGGATLQFSMIPMNLMKNGKAVYIETGAWSKKAIAEAKKVGEVIVAASSKDKNYTYVPDCSDLDIPEDTDYVYICENETIHGVTWNKLPNTKGHVLVSVGHQILIGNAAPGGQRMGAGDLEKLQLKAGALHVADLRVDAGDHGAVDDGKAKDPLIPGDARLQIGHADGKMVDAVDGDGHSTPPVQLTMEVC